MPTFKASLQNKCHTPWCYEKKKKAETTLGLISSAQTGCQACLSGWSVCIPWRGQFTACFGGGAQLPLCTTSPAVTTWVALVQRWHWGESPQERGPSFFPLFSFFFVFFLFSFCISRVLYLGPFGRKPSFITWCLSHDYRRHVLWRPILASCSCWEAYSQAQAAHTECEGLWSFPCPVDNENEIKMKHLAHKYNLCVTLNRL